MNMLMALYFSDDIMKHLEKLVHKLSNESRGDNLEKKRMEGENRKA